MAEAYRAVPVCYKNRMIRIRPATDEDAAGIIELIGGVFAEFEGCVLDLEGIDADLLHPASCPCIDRFWVMDLGGAIVGTGACSFHDGYVELKKMYIERAHRGRGYGRKLVNLVEETALKRGLSRIELWSDTRFLGAHRMYQHLGYVRSEQTRELHDPSDTTEYHFVRTL